MDEGEGGQGGRRPAIATDRSSTIVPLVLGGVVFGICVAIGASAAASSGNCGELPGITQTITFIGGALFAGFIVIMGLVGAAVARNGVIAMAAWLIGLAIVLGLGAGIALGPHNPCGSDQPRPARQVAELSIVLEAPFTAGSVTGRAECRRGAPGAPVQEVVSEGSYASWELDWRLGDQPLTFVNIEIWPTTAGPYRPAEHLRITVNQPEASGFSGASSMYSDGHAQPIDLTTAPDAHVGTIAFRELPLWQSDSVFGTGLPATITGEVSWACTGPER